MKRWALALLLGVLACKRTGEEDLRKGNVFFAHQEWAEAEAHFRAALETAPDSTTAMESLGNVAYERGQVDQAVEWYQKALTVDERAISARQKLAIALGALGRKAEARKVLERTIELAPEDPFAPQVLGTMLQQQGELARAEALQRQALVADPEYHAARYALANLMIDDGRLAEAEKELERLLRRKQEALAEYGYARLAAKRQHAEEAARHLTRLLALGVSHPARILDDPAFVGLWQQAALAPLKQRLEALGTITSTQTSSVTPEGRP